MIILFWKDNLEKLEGQQNLALQKAESQHKSWAFDLA